MLCNDNILREDLKFGDSDKPTADDLLEKLKGWCRSRNAVTYIVLLNSMTVVGIISLSHINKEQKTARIGYWIGSRYRSKGYCTRAFQLVINEAVNRGITKLTSTIAEDNVHSRGIWDKLGGCTVEGDRGRLTYELLC